MVSKLGVNSSRFDTPHHTKRTLFVQAPEKLLTGMLLLQSFFSMYKEIVFIEDIVKKGSEYF